jgi:hypothetical protein
MYAHQLSFAFFTLSLKFISGHYWDTQSIDAALPCFYVYTQSEESTPYESATTRSENPAEGDSNDPLNEIEDPYGIVEGVGELWDGEDYEPDQALSADRTYLKFKKKLDVSPEQCFRYDALYQIYVSSELSKVLWPKAMVLFSWLMFCKIF